MTPTIGSGLRIVAGTLLLAWLGVTNPLAAPLALPIVAGAVLDDGAPF